MSSLNLDTWSTTPASNNAATPNGAPEGQAPSTLNDCMRQFMACVVTYGRSLPTAGGSANAQTLVNAIPMTVLVAGYLVVFLPVAANTGAWTFAPDGLTAKNVYANGAACVGGEAQANVPAYLKYDGTQWNLLNPNPPGRNALIDPCCRVARGDGTTTLATSYKYGLVDLVQVKATGTAVSAGTITQDTSATVAAATAYSAKIAGATITGTGKVFFRRWIESRDAIALKNKTGLFSVIGYQDTGGAINAFLTINKANSQDNFSAVTLIATGSTVSMTTATATTINVATAMGDCSNGIEIILEMDCGAVTTKNFYATDWQAAINTLTQTCAVPRFEDDYQGASRYFEKSYEDGTAAGTNTANGMRAWMLGGPTANLGIVGTWAYLVPKIAAPADTPYSDDGTSGKIRDSAGGGNKSVTVTPDKMVFQIVNNSGGALTDADPHRFQYTADARL